MDLNQLKILNEQGLIPGPLETSEAFMKRADYCLKLKQLLSDGLKENLGENAPEEVLGEGKSKLNSLYGFFPGWIPLFFSNYRLPFWQGGSAWIFQIDQNSPTSALIQLRRNFKDANRYLGIYDRSELLEHELTHVGRMAFQEPKFEEIIAYQTAKSPFRRYFGPLFQSSFESVFFVLAVGLTMVFDVFLLALNRPDAYQIAFWLKLIPLALFFLALIRLGKRQSCFKKSLQNLTHFLDNPEKARAVIYRLTDAEIEQLAKIPSQDIKQFAELRSQELRWQLILEAYF